jgi:hypothetical protein
MIDVDIEKNVAAYLSAGNRRGATPPFREHGGHDLLSCTHADRAEVLGKRHTDAEVTV